METSIQSAKEVLLPVINHFFSPCSAYVVTSYPAASSDNKLAGTETQKSLTCFIVVVFSETAPPDAARMASDAIPQQTNYTVSATFLLHRTRDLRTKNTCLQSFFYNVLRDGQRLCINTAYVPYLPFHNIPLRNPDEVSAYWYKCEAVASLYLEAAATGRLDIELVKIALLHTAVEQICLGLIRILSGYTPNTHGLRFLLDLCGHFTPLPGECFPQHGEANLRRFKRLCAPPSMLRHWVHLEAPEADFLILYENTREFLKQATGLAKSELQKMNNNQQKK